MVKMETSPDLRASGAKEEENNSHSFKGVSEFP
jgi:hypothetical protein